MQKLIAFGATAVAVVAEPREICEAVSGITAVYDDTDGTLKVSGHSVETHGRSCQPVVTLKDISKETVGGG